MNAVEHVGRERHYCVERYGVSAERQREDGSLFL